MNAEEAILEKLEELQADLAKLAPPVVGLLGFEGLRRRLAIDGKAPCIRTVKDIAARHRTILRPVLLGNRTVGFRPASVDALLAHLAKDKPIGGPRL